MKQLLGRFASALTATMSGQSISRPAHLPTATPSAGPEAIPIAMPTATPPPTDIRQDESTPDQKFRGYPIYDGRIIVGFSSTPAVSRSPRIDAEALLKALVVAGHAGESILARAVEELYGKCCAAAGIEPYAWQPLATELIDLTGGQKPYERVRGVKKRVYKIPDQLAAAVVDIEAARKRA